MKKHTTDVYMHAGDLYDVSISDTQHDTVSSGGKQAEDEQATSNRRKSVKAATESSKAGGLGRRRSKTDVVKDAVVGQSAENVVVSQPEPQVAQQRDEKTTNSTGRRAMRSLS